MTIAGEMLRVALEKLGEPIKSVARETGYSVDAFYAAQNGKRHIPQDAKPKLSQKHPMFGMAIAYEDTGYQCFTYINRDRHIQTMIRRLEKEDMEADKALQPLGIMLVDKNDPEDLTPEDEFTLKAAAKEISDRIQADLNLLVEMETRYRLGLTEYLAGGGIQAKEKPASQQQSVAEKRASYPVKTRSLKANKKAAAQAAK